MGWEKIGHLLYSQKLHDLLRPFTIVFLFVFVLLSTPFGQFNIYVQFTDGFVSSKKNKTSKLMHDNKSDIEL